MENTQLKSPKSMGRMIKKYGPGFVALSMRSGRVVAYGKNMKELWANVKTKKIFKEKKVVIQHVPHPDALSIY